MDRRAWIILVVAVLIIAALIVAYYLGLLGNRAVAERAPANEYSMVFQQFSDLLATEGSPPDPVKAGEIAARFGLELDLPSIPRLTAEHGLTFGRD